MDPSQRWFSNWSFNVVYIIGFGLVWISKPSKHVPCEGDLGSFQDSKTPNPTTNQALTSSLAHCSTQNALTTLFVLEGHALHEHGGISVWQL